MQKSYRTYVTVPLLPWTDRFFRGPDNLTLAAEDVLW